MRKMLTLICCLFSLVCPVLAENFYIENYDIKINVDKNKSAAIVENLDVYFTKPSHGIFRDIPQKNATITDVKVSETATKTASGSKLNIKIGNPDVYVSGKHHYTIQYNYNYLDNKNEFYHNIIGTDWNTYINNVKFDITMPDNVKTSDVGLSIGYQGTKGFNGNAIYYVDGNHIYGHTYESLKPNEGMTIRIEVPKGYFSNTVNEAQYFNIFILIAITIFAFAIWFLFGKDEPVIPVVNFYPPNNLSPIELELAYKGKASAKGLVGMLIDLARQGYVKIDCRDHGWSIWKLKEHDGIDKTFYKKYMQALFKGEAQKVTKNELAMSESFYKSCTDIIESVNKLSLSLFEIESISTPLKTLMTLCLIGIVLLTFLTVTNSNFSVIIENLPTLIFSVIAIIIIVFAIKNSCLTNFHVIKVAIFGGISLLVYLSENFVSSRVPTLITGVVALIVTAICFYQLPKRNKVGQKLLNNITGFKHFLEVAEKQKLKSLVNEDSEYFYKTLPYAYVLGISNTWISKFKGIIRLKPTWYVGGILDANSFNHFTNNLHGISVPTIQNGGVQISTSSSGGGGCSGGGGGGGGGGSW